MKYYIAVAVLIIAIVATHLMFSRVNQSFAYTIQHDSAAKVIQSFVSNPNPRAAAEQYLMKLSTLAGSLNINSNLSLQRASADTCGELRNQYFDLADSLLGMFDDLVGTDDSDDTALVDQFDAGLEEFTNVAVRIAISRCSF